MRVRMMHSTSRYQVQIEFAEQASVTIVTRNVFYSTTRGLTMEVVFARALIHCCWRSPPAWVAGTYSEEEPLLRYSLSLRDQYASSCASDTRRTLSACTAGALLYKTGRD